MITAEEKRTIQNITNKYKASRVLLFGSAANQVDYEDIDIAVDGIPDEDFYAFYGELMCALSKSIDIVDLSKKSKFIDLILQEGVLLDS